MFYRTKASFADRSLVSSPYAQRRWRAPAQPWARFGPCAGSAIAIGGRPVRWSPNRCAISALGAAGACSNHRSSVAPWCPCTASIDSRSGQTAVAGLLPRHRNATDPSVKTQPSATTPVPDIPLDRGTGRARKPLASPSGPGRAHRPHLPLAAPLSPGAPRYAAVAVDGWLCQYLNGNGVSSYS